MNKNKYIIIFLILISFFTFNENVFADLDPITYDLEKGELTINVKASKKITTAVLNCDGKQAAFFENVNNKKLYSTFDITQRLTVGEHNCNIYYNVEGSDTTSKALDNDVYVNITVPNKDTPTCKSYSNSSTTCKQKGCFYNNKFCTGYMSDISAWNINTNDNSSSGSSSNSSSSSNNSSSSGSNSSSNNNNATNSSSGSSSSSSTSNDLTTSKLEVKPLESGEFCHDISPGLKIAGYTILIIKIITPLAIILMGSFDFYKAVSTGKPDDLKKQAILLGNRVITGLIIFFLPAILKTTLDFLSGESEYITCIDCLFDPNNSCK